MLISCPHCSTRYNLTAAQIGPEGRMLKCAKCGHQWFVDPQPSTTDADIPPPMPPENPVGLDELAFTASQPAWYRTFGAGLTMWLIGLTTFLALALAVTLWLLLSPPEDYSSTQPTPITEPQPQFLVLSNLERTLEEDGMLVILKFTGTITNESNNAQNLPELRLQLLDDKGIELDFWPADVAKPALNAGESTRWAARFINPPLERIATWRAFFKTAPGDMLPATVENEETPPATTSPTNSPTTEETTSDEPTPPTDS